MRALFAIVLAAAVSSASAASCDKKEYAEYKDMASTELGQIRLGGAYCQWKARKKGSADLAALASKYGRSHDYAVASADESSCDAEMSKISTALSSTKGAARGSEYIQKNCP